MSNDRTMGEIDRLLASERPALEAESHRHGFIPHPRLSDMSLRQVLLDRFTGIDLIPGTRIPRSASEP